MVSAVVLISAALLAGCGSDASTSGSSSNSPSVEAGPAGSVARSSSTGMASSSGPVLDPAHPPPYIEHVSWVDTAVGPSLQIYPTPNGRASIADDGAQVAWREVLALAPDADTPGMRAQFVCHWDFARAVEPNKPSWNIEPQRPVVDNSTMIATRCNPGGPEE
ncbi:DUF2599 domain-containing protein [Gordonia aichiensis]